MPTWFQRIFSRSRNKDNSIEYVLPKKARAKRVGHAFVRGGGDTKRAPLFQGNDFDLVDVERAYNTDGYVRQALDKYTELMFKAGWTLTGRNERAVRYVKLRLKMMALATGQPTDLFLIEAAESLVKYANVFIVKARAKGGLGYNIPGFNIRPVTGKYPIAGYFILPPSTIKIARDKNGNVIKYQQTFPGAPEPLEFDPDDIIHIYYKKEHGKAFGVPFAIPVLDDVRLLREVEENVARLIYRHLHPLYMYKVGLPQPGYEATDQEIESIRAEIEDMPSDGGIVLPERHNIESVGADGEALDANNYLKHFEQRVFTGLGVSEVAMGRGNTANRGTADTMTTEMHDRIKALQKVLSIGIDFYIINELLMEGGFNPIFNEDDNVDFRFNEIALDEKIKVEAHEVFKFTSNAISFEEMRNAIGDDPVTDEGRLYFNMVTIPTAQATAEAKAENSQAENIIKPENQHGQKTSPKKTSSSYESKKLAEAVCDSRLDIVGCIGKLDECYQSAKQDIVQIVQKLYANGSKSPEDYDPSDVGLTLSLTKERMTKFATQHLSQAFLLGAESAKSELGVSREGSTDYSLYLAQLRDRVSERVDGLVNRLSELLEEKIRSSDKANVVEKTIGVFDALNYRVRFISHSELNRAYNYGYAVKGMLLDRKHVQIIHHDPDSDCEECNSKLGAVELSGYFLDKIPPWHSNCACKLTFNENA